MNMNKPLWPLQERALDFVKDKNRAALFMWMGTGKTRVALEWIRYRQLNPVLIVCPKPVIDVWEEQIAEYLNTHSSVAVRGTLKQRKELLATPANIHIINYEALRNKDIAATIKNFKWDGVILDESHRIKARGSKVSRYFAHIPVENRLILSGTFLPNKRLDVYGQFRFLDSTVFGTNYNKFESRYAIRNPYVDFPLITGYQREEEFFNKLGKYAFVADRSQAQGLPPVTTSARYFDLPPKVRKIYNDMKKEFVAGDVVATNAAVKLMYMQMITGGFLDGEPLHDERFKVVDSVREDYPYAPLVIYCRFTPEVLALVKRYNAYELSGRKNEVSEWRKTQDGILVVQEQAGAEGIDLSHACTMVRYSVSYNYGVYEQSNARLVRPNSPFSHVSLIHVQAKNTVDAVVLDALSNKRDDLDYVMEKLKHE